MALIENQKTKIGHLFCDHAGFVKIDDRWPDWDHIQILSAHYGHLTKAVVAFAAQSSAWECKVKGNEAHQTFFLEEVRQRLEPVFGENPPSVEVLALGPTGIIVKVPSHLVPAGYAPLYPAPAEEDPRWSQLLSAIRPFAVPRFSQINSDVAVASFKSKIQDRIRQLEKSDRERERAKKATTQ